MKNKEIRWDIILVIILSLVLVVFVVIDEYETKNLTNVEIVEDPPTITGIAGIYFKDQETITNILTLIDQEYPEITLLRIYYRNGLVVYEVTYKDLTYNTYKKKDTDRENLVISLAGDIQEIVPEQILNIDVLDISDHEIILFTVSSSAVEWSSKRGYTLGK